jgi:hypothetical protein
MERCTNSRSRSYGMAHNVYTSSDKWCSKFMSLHVCFHKGECACVVIVYVVLCNSQKQKFSAYSYIACVMLASGTVEILIEDSLF